MSKTILVTGTAGFIGSHVAEALLVRGDIVVGLDNLNDYYDPVRKKANLLELESSVRAPGQFTFVYGDIRDQDLLTQLFSSYSFDLVIHLAAMAGVRVSIQNPLLYYEVNLIGTLNLLNAARDNHVQHLVLVSTSSVYGNTKQIPFTESDICDRPLAPYPASKRAAEMLGYAYHHLYGLNCTVLRLFTVYGPRGRPDMVAYKVLDSMFYGQEVPLHNDGQMHRDWTYIQDIAAGVLLAADRSLGYEIINLGRSEPVLLADFVHMLEELTGRKPHLVPVPMPDTDIPYTWANIEKARRLLGYEPRVSVAEGVSHLWQWYRRAVLGHGQ